MTKTIIPASPNWYCTKVTDSNKRNILVFASRHDIYIFGYDQYPAQFSGVFVGHKEKVTALSLCNHDQYVMLCCSGSEDGSVKLWNTVDCTVSAEHIIHKHRVTAISWSEIHPDLIVSGDDNGLLGVWQVEDNRQAAHRLDKTGITALAMAPFSAGLTAVGFKSGLILLLDVKKGSQVVCSLKGHDEELHALAWSPVPGENFKPAPPAEAPDITDLETFGVDDSWRKKPKEPLVSTEFDGFGEDGWLLASGCRDKTIRLWSTSKGRQLGMYKLPNPGRRDPKAKEERGGRSQPWITIHWLTQAPNHIISSSLSGDLLLWDITKSGKEKNSFFHKSGRGHLRSVFNICPVGEDTLCTISMDRQIMFWDIKLRCQQAIMPSLGGYVYAMKVSPFDPGRLSLGVGDGMIRVWNLNSPPGVSAMTQYWQGIKSKVTALSWHPAKEGLLAYGTEDGRVGIYNTLSNKPPQISTTYHRRTVYVVAWAPASTSTSDTGSPVMYNVYSCGDGNVLEHQTQCLDREAVNIGQLIQANNPQYRATGKMPTRSEISWNADLTVVAIGNDDGSVEIFSSPGFLLLGIVQTHHKLVNVIAWHPTITMETTTGSAYRNFMAIASNEFHISVVDLNNLLDHSDSLQVTETWRRLEGHSNRVTGLAWSPHSDMHLVSVSYDKKALVWNVEKGTVLACYEGHIGRLLCCQWNCLDPSEVITGGDDYSIHVWAVGDHPLVQGLLDAKKKKKKKNKSKTVSEESATSIPIEATFIPIETSVPDPDEQDDLDDLEKLLEEKRRELLGEGQSKTADKVSTPLASDTAEEMSVSLVAVQQTTIMKQKRTDKSDSRKKLKSKSMFPVMSKRDNSGRQTLLEDVISLAKLIYGDGEAVKASADVTHLGLFLDRRAAYACLDVEGQYHRNNENMDYFYQLEVWKGNISGALRVARQRDELSDWLVAMAPMASFETWTSVCEDYAIQLETDGQYHKAASYFLACHKVYEAIRLFKRHKLFKEAIALAKVRLSPLDPALEELYTLWAQQLTKDGNLEQAAKCHLAMRQVQDAAKLLARRYDQSSLRTAAHISIIANDKQQGLMYTQRVVQQHLLQNEWGLAYQFLEKNKEWQVYLATSSMHEMVSCELTSLGLLQIEPAHFSHWDQRPSNKSALPDLILDPGDVDSMSPWQLHLIEGHTFPHHILRTWYRHFDVCMDTTSVEDMYKTLCLLHAGRQAQVEQAQLLIQVCTDLTLCMLSLMMSETPTAMSHLLQAVGSLHEAGHLHLVQGLLRLFLPQGPKYILKLQQEVTAMRVMISMDTHTHVDGASKVHTIKRYLSEHKDDGVVNNSSLRCRELDYLRAYYYVAILNFLKESCFSREETIRETKETESSESGHPLSCDGDKGNEAGEVNKNTDHTDVDSEDSSVGNDTIVQDYNLTASKNSVQDSESGINENVTASHCVEGVATLETGPSLQPQSNQSESSLLPVSGKTNQKHSLHRPAIPVLNVNHYVINITLLTRLAHGLLWDIQAKKFALTETLGYIHKAISQLLLSKNSQPLNKVQENETGASEPQEGTQSIPDPRTRSSEDTKVKGCETGSNIQGGDSSFKRGTISSENVTSNQGEGAVAKATEKGDYSSSGVGMVGRSSRDEIIHFSEHHFQDHHHQHHHELHMDGHVCHEVLSHHFDHVMNIHVPHVGEVPIKDCELETETEIKYSFFDVCSSCEVLHKSRKILFDDEPQFYARPESGFKDVTNITNPAKYINVPDEWYGMPVDQKYFKRYVTMAILKDEQEYVMTELKRAPDCTQALFPSPLESVRSLVEVAGHSSHISTVERQQLAQKVIMWALNFACTSQQKQNFLNLLQAQIEH